MGYRYLKSSLLLLVMVFSCKGFVGQPQTSDINHLPMDLNKNGNLAADKEMKRKTLYNLLGKLPDRQRPISVKVLSREETDELVIEKLLLDINGIELVPAYFTKPKNSNGRIPVVLFNHSHFGQ